MKVVIAKHLSKKKNGDYISSEIFLNEMIDKGVVYPYTDDLNLYASDYEIAIVNSYRYLINKVATNDIVKYIFDLFVDLSYFELSTLLDNFEIDMQRQLSIHNVRQSFILDRANIVRESLKEYSVFDVEYSIDPYTTIGEQAVQLLTEIIERDFLRYYYSYLHDRPRLIMDGDFISLIKYNCQYQLLDYLTSRYDNANVSGDLFIEEFTANHKKHLNIDTKPKAVSDSNGLTSSLETLESLFKDKNQKFIDYIVSKYWPQPGRFYAQKLLYLIRALIELDEIYCEKSQYKIAKILTNTFKRSFTQENISKSKILDLDTPFRQMEPRHYEVIESIKKELIRVKGAFLTSTEDQQN
jgi:hypothetical protein